MDKYTSHFKKLKQEAKRPSKAVKPGKVSLSYKSNRVRSRNNSGSYILGTLCALAFLATGYAFLYPEEMDKLTKHVDISFITMSEANDSAAPAPADPANPAASPDAKEEKNAAATPEEKAAAPAAPAPAVSEKPNYAQGLLDKEKELDERAARLAELESKLQLEKEELDKKIAALEQTRRDIASRLENRVAADEENITKLVGVYSNMKPQAAATVISKLDDELAINILRRMKKQEAGSILNFIEPQKAKTLSEKYSGY